MRRTSTTVVTIAASAALLGVLAACGGSSPSSSPKSSSPSSSPKSSSPSSSPKSPSPSSTSPQDSPPATEFSPPGDIPDNQVFLDFKVPGSQVHVKVPEGWAKKTIGGSTTFTDHYNSVTVDVMPQAQAPTVQSAIANEVPAIAQKASNFKAGDVTSVTRAHGNAILVTYQQDSAADPVTGKVVRDAVERYEFWKNGQEAILTLTGPTNADNVDPWQIVSDSLHWK